MVFTWAPSLGWAHTANSLLIGEVKCLDDGDEVVVLLVFLPHVLELLLISLLWCRCASVKDVAVQLPFPVLLLPNDDVLAVVDHVPRRIEELER